MESSVKRLMLSVILLAVGSGAIAQSSSTQNPSPGGTPANKAPVAGATSDGAGSLYNVNLYDGTAGVTIPIYEYSIAGLNLGVSLGYDTHGIKVDQTSSQVGLGWDLGAGGTITRQINGIPDELVRFQSGVYDTRGKWMNSNANTSQEGEYDVFSASFGGRSIHFHIWYNGSEGLVAKVSPDIPGLKVNLYLENRNTGDILPFGRADGQIDKSKSEKQLMIEIVDEHNNAFLFSRGNLKKEIPEPEYMQDWSIKFQPATEWWPETWDLVRVVTRYQDTIKYTYGYNSDVSYPLYKNEELRVSSVAYSHFDYRIGDWVPEADGIKVIKNEMKMWEGDISYLSKIEYPNGVQVLFDMPAANRYDLYGANPVSKITIKHALDNNIGNSLTYKFNYAYFHTPSSSVPAAEVSFDPNSYNSYLGSYGNQNDMANAFRLKLRSIERTGTDGSTTEPYYSFDYNSTALPARLSPSKDYFGYYNGQASVFNVVNGASSTYWSTRTNLQGLGVSKQTYNDARGTITFGVDRTPSLAYCKAGILQKITNAGGGTIELFYKDHVLTNPANGLIGFSYIGTTTNNMPAILASPDLEGSTANDGLCIDKVIVKDGVNPDNTTTEQYEYEGGQRFYPGGHFWYVYDMDFTHAPFVTGKEYLNSFVNPMEFINGSNHGYTYATIRKYGYNNALLGSTRYHFTNLMLEGTSTERSNLEFFSEGNVTNSYIPFQNLNTYDFSNPLYYQFSAQNFCTYRMGKVLEEESYDHYGVLTAKTAYTYNDLGTDHNTLALYSAVGSNVSSYFRGYDGGYFSFTSAPYLLAGKTATIYTGTGNSSSTVNYTYNEHWLLNTERTTDYLGRQLTKLYTYTSLNPTYGGSNIPNETGALPIYYNYNNFISDYDLPTGVKTFKTINGTEYCLGATRNDYKERTFFAYRTSGHNYYRPYKTYTMLNEQPFPLSSYPQGEQVVNEITKYDSRNNIIEVKYEDKDLYACSVWDTRIGKKIAAVRNAKYDQIAYTSFEGNTFAPMGVPDENKGNWDFDPQRLVYNATIATGGAMTGKYCYSLTGGSAITSVNALESGKDYVLSFWADAPPTVTSGARGTLPLQQLTQIGNWKLYTIMVPGTGSNTVNISTAGADIRIDELRLHPADATMTTTTYEPMFGPSSMCDARNNIIYTEYDAMGRATTTRDINGNILSLTQTVIGGTSNK